MRVSVKNLRKRLSRDPLTRGKARRKHYERRLRHQNLHVYKAHLNWVTSESLRALLRDWGDTPGIPADRCCFLHDLARLVRHRRIPGDTAECGVRFGKSSYFLLRGLDDPGRPHHLFDSFSGLPPAGPRDRAANGRTYWSEGDAAAPEAAVRLNLASYPNCRFHVGFIPERFAEVANRVFALVHIDVDLFEPTRHALEFFWPRLVPGGLMVCDDYGFATCPGAARAFDEFFRHRREGVLPIPTGQCLVWKDP